MIEKGRYFYFLNPPIKGALYYLAPAGVYNEVSREFSALRENGRNESIPNTLGNSPSGIIDKNSSKPASGYSGVSDKSKNNYKQIFTRSALLVPAFIYHVYEQPPLGAGKSSGHLLDYPPPAYYVRRGGQIQITPYEYRLESGAFCRLSSDGYVREIPVKTNGAGFDLEPGFFAAFKKNKRAKIELVQNEMTFLLENFPGAAAYTYEKTQTVEFSAFSYLSVKDILDPKGGLERLIYDLNRNMAKDLSQKQRWQNPRKMGKLLDIIRSARDDEEEKILSALYHEDEPFFHEVTYRLFSDDLVAYMDAREISGMLMKAPDNVFAGLDLYAPELRSMYQKLISRRRWEDLLLLKNRPDAQDGPKKPGELKPGEKSAIWRFIENEFRKQKERSIYLKKREAVFYSRLAEPGPDLQKTPETCKSGFLSTNSDIYVVSVNQGTVTISLEKPMKQVYVYARTYSGDFALSVFRFLPAGLLEADFAGVTRKTLVAIGAIDYENQLAEALCLPVTEK